jgi:predicted DNA-binding transcriptional regulator AlpA
VTEPLGTCVPAAPEVWCPHAIGRHPADAPPAGRWWTKHDVAAFLAISPSALDDLRRADPAFPPPVLIRPASPRWWPAALADWSAAASRPPGAPPAANAAAAPVPRPAAPRPRAGAQP